eukprot:3046423-Amphidinium_carterae.1
MLAHELAIREEIGRGMYAVYRGEWRQGEKPPREVAIKIYRGDAMTDNTSFRKAVQENARLQHQASHRNILQVLGLCWDHPDARYSMLLVTPLIHLGSLHAVLYANAASTAKQLDTQSMLVSDNSRVPAALADLFHGVAAALQYIHHRREPICHLDLKPDNILLEVAPALPTEQQ